MDGKDTKRESPEDAAPAPQYARAAGRRLPPAKAFMAKPFSARSLMAPGKPGAETLHQRLHGQGPIVKWPAAKPASRLNHLAHRAATPALTPLAAGAPVSTGENMSERFIAERLMSERGTSSNFNSQIPRRVPDIPSPSAVKASEADLEGKRLLIGRAVQLYGEIGGCERLVVEGKVDVTLKDVKTLEVGAQGVFKGNAVVEAAVIAGAFEGTLKVSGHLDVGPGAVVKGTVSYGTIAVASGGKLLGTIESVESSAG